MGLKVALLKKKIFVGGKQEYGRFFCFVAEPPKKRSVFCPLTTEMHPINGFEYF